MKLGLRAPLAATTLALAAALALGVASPQAMAVPLGASHAKLAPTDLGAAPATEMHTLSLGLALRNSAALDTLLDSLADPKSPSFRQFLTPAQFGAQFGQTPAAVAQVVAYLKAQGFAVLNVQANNLMITIRGTNAQIAATFGTSIHNYTEAGIAFQAPAAPAVMPAAFANVAIGLGGLGNRANAVSHLKTVHNAGVLAGDAILPKVVPTPATAATATPGSWTVADLAIKYNVNPLYGKGLSGAGRTIGIATLATYNQADVFAYWNMLGLNVAPDRITDVPIDTGEGPVGTNGNEETTLDVAQSGGLAPGAKMRVYMAPNTNAGFLAIFAQAVNEDLVDVLSVSWGSPEIFYDGDPQLTLLHNVFRQAAAQGIPVIAASGDSGAYDFNRNYPYPDCSAFLTVDFPSSDPYVLAAGGTSLPNVSHHKFADVTQPYERPWGGDYMKQYITDHYGLLTYYAEYLPEGGGGGVSTIFAKPAFQAGLAGTQVTAGAQSLLCDSAVSGAPASAGLLDLWDLPAGLAGRNVPDVSLNADPASGYLLYVGSTMYAGYGGTSFVAPQLNGILTLISSGIAPTAANPKGRVGRPAPQMYAAFKAQGYAAGSPFKAITVGDNQYWKASASYNPATGLGSLDVNALATALGVAP